MATQTTSDQSASGAGGPASFDQHGRTTFDLFVVDLDAAHARVLEVGAAEVVAFHSASGMPRNSAVTDPDGNWIWLFQG